MKVTWLESLQPNQMALSADLFKALKEPTTLILYFGALQMEQEIVSNNELAEGTIGLAVNLSDKYTFPTDLSYECYLKEGVMYVGPVIALITFGRLKNLNKRIYNLTLTDYLDYNSIGGLIYICNKDSIDIEQGVVKGFYFDPKGETPKKKWKFGKFPLPNAVINRSFISEEKIASLQETIGDKVFNSYYYNLDKWSTWEFLSKNEQLSNHLPYTEEYKGAKQLERMLNKYVAVYLKPAKNSQGRGMIKVDKTDEGISAVDFERQENRFKDCAELAQFLDSQLDAPYIVQQAINFMANNRNVDFRLVLQKDASKEWLCSGLVARIAYEGSIITNSRGRETSVLGREALLNIFKVDEETAENTEKKMTRVVMEAVKMYEQEGLHLGDLAVDMALDESLNPWIFEIQLNYGVDGRSKVIPYNFFHKVLNTPFYYAKALAGFETEK